MYTCIYTGDIYSAQYTWHKTYKKPRKVVAVVAPHCTEAPETVVQPWNVEQSTQSLSFWAYDLNYTGIGCGRTQASLYSTHFFRPDLKWLVYQFTRPCYYLLVGVFQEKYKLIFVREIMEFGTSTSYIRKSGVPFVFIERAMDTEVDFIFHCTADVGCWMVSIMGQERHVKMILFS